MVVLDTDHASELGMRSAAGLRLLQRLEAAPEDAAITAITVEEGMRGWLAEIRRHTDPARQMAAYDHLVRQVELFAAWGICPGTRRPWKPSTVCWRKACGWEHRI